MKNRLGLGCLAFVALACGGGTSRLTSDSQNAGGTAPGDTGGTPSTVIAATGGEPGVDRATGGLPAISTTETAATGGAPIITDGYPVSTAPLSELQGPWNTPVAPTRAALESQLSALANLTTGELMSRSSGALSSPLGYDPATAQWLDTIQASPLALSDSEMAAYRGNGFVISNRQSYPNFVYGYKAIYAADLPVYISADSILYAVHRSYDDILMTVEQNFVSPTLKAWLSNLRASIPSAPISSNSKHDLGLLLGVAAGLLDSQATGIDAEMSALIAQAKTASGTASVNLFGTPREIDFSQFLPRGHYATAALLPEYFRAMMWLGRIELRLTDVSSDGRRVLNRREVEDVLALRELLNSDLLGQWNAMNHLIGLFVGEPDYMTVPQIQTLQDGLGIASSQDLATVADDKLLQVIDAGNFGLQRICSQLMVVDPNMTTLANSFAVLGQRYTVDAHVLSKVVYPNSNLLMPSPLDAAFAAFGNDQAAGLLRPQLDAFGYAPALGQARELVEQHDASYWNSSMYTFWVSALRQISSGKYATTGLPAVARTDAWGRRLLNTQLSSWAQLRHDTLLYAKQSYTGGFSCEYPDGYVDPYPELFGRLRAMGTFATETLAAAMPASMSSSVASYFTTLANVAGRLEIMAREELLGASRTPEDIAFLNDAVALKTETVGCASITRPVGWYSQLFFTQSKAIEADPTIADVHTQPTDEGGNPVGKVLHVATGNPRLMVVSVDSCNGPRAFAGVVSSYFEQTTNNFQRKTDENWATELKAATPSDVSWMQDIVVR